MASKKTTKKSNSSTPIILAGLAAAGAAAGFFLYGPKGKDNRKKIQAWSLKAKAEVLEKVEKAKEISEDKYHEIVDSVTERYGKLKDVHEKEALTLNKELKKYWKEIQKQATPKAKKVTKKATAKKSK